MPVMYPPINQPMTDTHGTVTRVWREWFTQLLTEAGTGGGAPTTGPYVLAAALGTLTAGRVLTAGTGISITDGGAGGPITVAATGGTSAPNTATYLTVGNETATLANSRRVLAGTGITFDDSVANVRTVNATAVSGGEWSILTDGDLANPQIIYSLGDVISVYTP